MNPVFAAKNSYNKDTVKGTAASYGDSNPRAQIRDDVHALVLNTEYGNIDVSFTA